MSDTARELGALRRAAKEALDAISTSVTDQTAMYRALSYDPILRGRQIAFWQRFLRERSMKIEEMRRSNPEVFASLSCAASLAQLTTECTRKDGLQPACMEEVLALSSGAEVPEADRVMEVLPSSWFVNPDQVVYKRLFPKKTTLAKYRDIAESFLVDGAVKLWRWLTAEPEPSPLDKIVADRLAGADFDEGYFVRVQDGRNAANKLLQLMKDSPDVIALHKCTVVTMHQMRQFPCDVASALSWLCREDSADVVFFTQGNRQLCGFCMKKEAGMRCPSFVPALLNQIYTLEYLENTLKQKGEQVNALIRKTRECIRNKQKERALEFLRRKRQIEGTIDSLTEKRDKVEQMMNQITQAETDSNIIDALHGAVATEKQMFEDNPELRDALDVLDEVNDGLQNAQDISNAIAKTQEDNEEYEKELEDLEESSFVPPKKQPRLSETRTSLSQLPSPAQVEPRVIASPQSSEQKKSLPLPAVKLHADSVPEGEHSDLASNLA